MGKYSGILICSDFDGTLFDGEKIPENNITAIKEFRREGGLFTVISGRPVNFLPPFFEGYKFGVPTVNLNGAVIYDVDEGKAVRETFMQGLTRELALGYASVVDDYNDLIFFPKGEILRIPKESTDTVSDELCQSTHKFIIELHSDCPLRESDVAYERVKDAVGDKFDVVRSSYRLIEILDKSLTKGKAARFLKEYTGSHTLVCVGDYENDIEMIKEADIGYAVSNASERVKASADRVTVSAEEGAIAKIISEL